MVYANINRDKENKILFALLWQPAKGLTRLLEPVMSSS